MDGLFHLKDKFEIIDLSDQNVDQSNIILKDAFAIIVKSKVIVDIKIKKTSPGIKIIARAGTGMENIDKEQLEKLGVKCISVPDGNSQSAAEFTLCMIMMLLRKFPDSIKQIESRNFRRHLLEGRELSAVKIGIIGLGNVGHRLAKMLKGLGADLICWDVDKLKMKIANDMGIKTSDALDSILSKSDVISLHVPLNNKTSPLIGNREINLLKKNVLIINNSRGKCIDKDALLYGLDNNIVSYFATDVLYPEPPFHKVEDNQNYNHPFLNHPKIFVTPHIAASTKEAQLYIATELAKKILDINNSEI